MCVCAVLCGLATAVVVHHTCSFSWASPAQRCPSHGFVQKNPGKIPIPSRKNIHCCASRVGENIFNRGGMLMLSGQTLLY